MLDDITPAKDKSSKKRKSKKTMDTADVQVAPQNVEEENLEKKKRRKSKKMDEPTEECSVENDDLIVGQAAQDSEKKKKKERKRKRDAEASLVQGDLQDHDAERKRKKKKRSHTENGDLMLVDGEGSSTLPEEKEKMKCEGDGEEGTISADAEPSTSEPKKKKKEKKKRSKESDASQEDVTSAEPSTAPSKAPSPKPTTITSTNPINTAKAAPADIAAFLSKHSITIHTPQNCPSVTPITEFSQLDIPEELKTFFASFKEPTPVQACTWPPAMEGRDVVGIAETGSGKTLAFGIPALTRLIKSASSKKVKSSGSAVSILVLAPTRELAIQTHDTLSALGKPFGIASVAVFGGVPKGPQIEMLKNASKNKHGLTTRIVVGTPGRILDLMQEGACDLTGVDYLVLDEADRMLDKGFENDIRNIISSTKPSAERQTMMFSATWPDAVRRLASTFLRDPVRVTVGSDDLTANSRVEQSVDVFDDKRSKDDRLISVLRSLSHKKTTTTGAEESRILIFALYKKEASRVEQMLKRQGYAASTIHGDLSQPARLQALENFKSGKTGLMVATDVAARGLDIPNVGAVINYTFPLTIEDYIHRIGRTGRGGKSGKSITFFTGDDHERALAGEFARVLREGGFEYEALKKFPMTIKKREHSAYGAFFRDDIPAPKGPTKIVF